VLVHPQDVSSECLVGFLVSANELLITIIVMGCYRAAFSLQILQISHLWPGRKWKIMVTEMQEVDTDLQKSAADTGLSYVSRRECDCNCGCVYGLQVSVSYI